MPHHHPSSSPALDTLLTLIYPPVVEDAPDATPSLLAELNHAKRYCRARLAVALTDLTPVHCERLLTEHRHTLHELVQECIELETAGYPLTTGTIATRLRAMARSTTPLPSRT